MKSSSSSTPPSTKGSVHEKVKVVTSSPSPDFSWPTVKHYLITRFTELVPSMEEMRRDKWMLNPMPGLRLISRQQWLMIVSAFLSWSWVCYDFFLVSLNVPELAREFDKSIHDITWGITCVLMVRTFGSIVFGLLGDRYGRKWPLILCLFLLCVLEIGTSFVKTYNQFLAVRCLYGILFGGIYGNAAATALDDCPMEARGFISGFLQQGFSAGSLWAVLFNRAIADEVPAHKWRANFWFGAAVSFTLIVFRIPLPETKYFLKQQEIQKHNAKLGIKQKSFFKRAELAGKQYWPILIFLVLFTIGFTFLAHASQDLYPTLLLVQYGFTQNQSTVTNALANLGAIIGGIFMGHISSVLGRRFTIILTCVFSGPLIYPWAFTHWPGINIGAFFLQFFLEGAWGPVPIAMSELAPAEFRALVVGTAYQLGTLASSASATIETSLGESFPITLANGQHGYDYATVMAIMVGCVFAYTILVTLLGPERRNCSLDAPDVAESKPGEQQP